VIILLSVSLSPPDKPNGVILTLAELPTQPGGLVSLSSLYTKRRKQALPEGNLKHLMA